MCGFAYIVSISDHNIDKNPGKFKAFSSWEGAINYAEKLERELSDAGYHRDSIYFEEPRVFYKPVFRKSSYATPNGVEWKSVRVQRLPLDEGVERNE